MFNTRNKSGISAHHVLLFSIYCFTYSSIVFRAKFERSKRGGTNKMPLIKVLFQSPCTSRQLPPVTHLLLEKSCKRKIRKSDGEVLILAKKPNTVNEEPFNHLSYQKTHTELFLMSKIFITVDFTKLWPRQL